jgi:hypothetical protein
MRKKRIKKLKLPKPATPTKTKTITATGLTREGKGRIDDDEQPAGKATGQTSFSDEANDEKHELDKWLAEGTARSGAERRALITNCALKISAAWYKSVHQILCCAKECANARKLFTKAELRLLFLELPFQSQTRFSTLVTIGNDRRLKGEIQKLLPPSPSTIYQIALLDDEQLELAKRKHLIRPDVTREEIIDFRKNADNAAPNGDGPDSIDDEFDEPELDDEHSSRAAMRSTGPIGDGITRQDGDVERAGGVSTLEAAYSELKREWVEASADARVHFVTKVLRIG